MIKITSEGQAKAAPKGAHNIGGKHAASGFGFKKDTDAIGGGGYTVRYRLGDKRPTMGLGAFSEISMANASKAAKDAVALARRGIDPIGARDREKAANLAVKKAVTFKLAAETYYAEVAPTLRHKYGPMNWINPVRTWAYPILGEMTLNDIMVEHVAAVVTAAAAKNVIKTGKLVQQRIRKIINAAIAKGQRDAVRGNPADAALIKAVLPALARKTVDAHFRRIKLDDAPAAFRAILEAVERAHGIRADELDVWTLMVSTCARPSEALRARWSHIDLRKRLWTIPAEQMKSLREHIAPLNEIAVATLGRLKLRGGRPASDFVFTGPSGAPLGYTNFALAPKRAGVNAGAPHSWRSIFSDWRGNETEFPRELAEFQLAHVVPGAAGDYQREAAPERRRTLMDAYGRWLLDDRTGVIAFPTVARA